MTMNHAEAAALIGRRALLRVSFEFQPEVEIIDAKASYGVDRVKVRPVAGEGEQWFNLSTMRLLENQNPEPESKPEPKN